MSDIIQLDTLDIPSGPSPAIDLGSSGLDLLKNDKSKKGRGGSSGDIEISDLSKLEDELNALSGRDTSASKSSGFAKPIELSFEEPASAPKPDAKKPEASGGGGGGMFSSFLFGGKGATEVKKMDVDGAAAQGSKGGGGGVDESIRIDNISSSFKNVKTADPFTSFNDIPVNPEKPPPKRALTREETMRRKFEMLQKFKDLEKKGVEVSKKYTMDSSLDEMEGEYESLVAERAKRNSVNFQGKAMMAVLTGLEFLNSKFDPFDLKLDGWAESVQENIHDYDEIFEELHKKYGSKSEMAPELKLIFQLGTSAVMLHMTNTMFRSAMPGMEDIMRQNPALAQQMQSAAIGAMQQNSPGFANFMGDMQQQRQRQPWQPRKEGGPPPPMETSTSGRYDPGAAVSRPPTPPPAPAASRPEIPRSRGPRPPTQSVRETRAVDMEGYGKPTAAPRPEMRGPDNMDDILARIRDKPTSRPRTVMEADAARGGGGGGSGSGSGLESTREVKSVSVDKPAETPARPKRAPRSRASRAGRGTRGDNSSTISVEELMAISKDADNLPRKSRRKPKSEKNTVSLDI